MLQHYSVEDVYTLTRKLPARVTHSFPPLTLVDTTVVLIITSAL